MKTETLAYRHVLEGSKALRKAYLMEAQGLACVDLWLTYVNYAK